MERINKVLTKVGLVEEDPKELAKKWQRDLRGEVRNLDKQLREIAKEEAKCKIEIRRLAKVGGQEAAIRSLAKEMISAHKVAERISIAKLNLDNCSRQIRQQAAQLRLQKVFESSTEAMKSMSAAMKIPEMQGRLRDMSVEMMKAGLIQEMADEAMDQAFADDSMESEADEEVNRVIAEATMSALDKAKSAPIGAPKGQTILENVRQAPEEEEEEAEEDDELERRMAALQS